MAAAAAALASNKNEPKVMCVSTQPKNTKIKESECATGKNETTFPTEEKTVTIKAVAKHSPKLTFAGERERERR